MKNICRISVILILMLLSSFKVCAQTSATLPTNNSPTGGLTTDKDSDKPQQLAVTSPRLASIHIRIDDKTMAEPGFTDTFKIREARNNAMTKLAETNLRGSISGSELKAVVTAVNAVNNVCALGTDYIQYRINKNSKSQFWINIVTGFFGVTTAAAPVVATAKAAGIAGLLASNYKSDILTNGDTGHSNAELKKVLEDVRIELASGTQNYNRALLMPNTSTQEQLSQYRHLQAAVSEMNAACAYF